MEQCCDYTDVGKNILNNLKKTHDNKDQYIPYIKCTDEKKHFSTFHSEIFFIQQHRQCAPNQINKKKQETHLQKNIVILHY